MKTFRILIVDDDETWAETLKENLETVTASDLAGGEYGELLIETVSSQAEADDAVMRSGTTGYDLVLLDLRYPPKPQGPVEDNEDKPFQGMLWLPELRRLLPKATVVILTSFAGQSHLQNVVAAIRDHRANDFIPKTAPFDNIVARIKVACGNAQRVQQLLMLEEEFRSLLRTRAARAYAQDVAELLKGARESLYRIARQIERQDPSANGKVAAAIIGEVDYLNRAFEQLTERLNKGQERRREVDVVALVRQLLMLYGRVIDNASAEVLWPNESQSLRLTTFEGDVRIALLEVLTNALEWLARSGTPVTERKLVVSVESIEGNAVICVTDNGDGFSKDAMEHIFEAGYSESLDDNNKGLGLYIAQRMMQEIGGEIAVRNRTEGGAEVKLFVRNLG